MPLALTVVAPPKANDEAVSNSEPVAVAIADSVMDVGLLTVAIVVPAGMPVPVTGSPADNATFPLTLTFMTDADPLVSVPVRPMGEVVPTTSSTRFGFKPVTE